MPVREGMVHWPGDPEVKLERVQSIAKGDEANLTRIDMSAHTGTHMDAPLHFFEDDPGMEAFPLEIGMGRRARDRHRGQGAHRPWAPRGPGYRERGAGPVRTVNSERAWWERDFDPDFVYVSYEAAELLGEIGVALVGVDYLSVGGPGNEGGDVHRALLGAGAWVVEGLDLSAVEPGDYELICLPIKLVGSDGAPGACPPRPPGAEGQPSVRLTLAASSSSGTSVSVRSSRSIVALERISSWMSSMTSQTFTFMPASTRPSRARRR